MKAPSLLKMLTYRRPAWSKTEQEFIRKYIDCVPDIYSDGYSNRILYRPESRVMIACHTDTVHKIGGHQRVTVRDGVVGLADGSASNCLGADDTAGVYAALRMIQAGVQCSFVFHRAEEIGGRGSAWLAEKYPTWLEQFDVCLSLDRRGTSDIITSQWSGRTASDLFAASLSDALGMDHTPASGTFTDSANYAQLISECSNLSVGYQCEHSAKETLDTVYLERLIDRLVSIDWNGLIVSRDKNELETWEDPFDEESDGERDEELLGERDAIERECGIYQYSKDSGL